MAYTAWLTPAPTPTQPVVDTPPRHPGLGGYGNAASWPPLPTLPGEPTPRVTVPVEIPPPPPPRTYEYASRPVTLSYLVAGAQQQSTAEGHAMPPISIYLGRGAAGPAVPGSVRFTFRGRTYVDRAGTLVYGVSSTTGAGTVAGSYDYSANTATLTDYAASGGNTVTLISLLSRLHEPGITGQFFRTPGAPLREGSFTVRAVTMSGEQLTAAADINGRINSNRIRGEIDWNAGLARLVFGEPVTAAGHEAEPWYDPDAVDANGKIWRPEPVDPNSIFFGAVVYQSIPADPEIIGLDPVRLPSDGRVVAYQPGGVVMVHHTEQTVTTPDAGAVMDFGRAEIALVEVFDAEGTPVETVWYSVDHTAGTLTWATPLNLSAYTMPLTVRNRIEYASQIADVQITGEITLRAPLPRAFPAGSMVSSAIAYGDMQARVPLLFDQATYQSGVWSDVINGNPAAGTYNTVLYPVIVENHSAIDERWAIRFTSPTTIEVHGERSGMIYTGNTTADVAPINPVTRTAENPDGAPYFIMRADGFGGGWATNNVIRFNTISATKPLWAARTTLQGEITNTTDACRIQAYMNAHGDTD